MIIKLLCLLGFHDWKYEFSNVRACWHCGYIEAVYGEEKKKSED